MWNYGSYKSRDLQTAIVIRSDSKAKLPLGCRNVYCIEPSISLQSLISLQPLFRKEMDNICWKSR